MNEENTLTGQKCPICHKHTLTLSEACVDVPHFGNVLLMSMTCSGCKYHKSDVEPENKGEPAKYTLDVRGKDDLSIRVVKSALATVKIPHLTTIDPGAAAVGYITNVEGILRRIKQQIDGVKNSSDDKDEKKQAYKLLKKINRIMWGEEGCKLILEDPSGNSAIISDKAVKGKLKK